MLSVKLQSMFDFMEIFGSPEVSIEVKKNSSVGELLEMLLVRYGEKLKEKMIDTRPFFPLMSTFRMFRNYNNPVARHLSEAGINLPSSYKLTRNDVVYICESLKKILGV